MTKRILIMGLPGAGKTYLAQHIVDNLQAEKKRVGWLNADDVRKKYDESRELVATWFADDIKQLGYEF